MCCANYLGMCFIIIIIREKMERIIRIGNDDSNDLGWDWQHRRTIFDVDQGKWAVEEFRRVKDLSALIHSLESDDLRYLKYRGPISRELRGLLLFFMFIR